MSAENKVKNQSWIKKLWLGNKLTIILIFILAVYLWLDIFFLGAAFTKLASKYLRSLPINSTDFLFAMILGLLILYVLSLCIDAVLPNIQKNKIMQQVEKTIISILPLFVSLLLANIAYTTWVRIHQKIPEIIQLTCLFIFVLLSVVALALTFEELNKKAEDSITWRVIKRGFLPFIPLPIIVIVSLLILDLTAFFTGSDLVSLYKDSDTRSFLFTLYAGAFAFFAFGVTLYVAHIRHTSLKLAEKQFIYTQTQKHEEEIEKRFQEGIKLLGNEQESVRLGGIFVLWEIVKDAVKALPYLENEYVYYAEYTDDKEQTYILPYRSEVQDNDLDLATQIEYKKRYLKVQIDSDAEIKAYKKAFSLYVQIFSILCAHIRTKTNSESYLKDYYPSIYQKLYPIKFKEYFGKKNKSPHIKDKNEKPSSEIQSLLNLLLQVPNNLITQNLADDVNAQRNHIPAHALNFSLDFEQAILKGGDFMWACFQNALCFQTNFQHTHCYKANFRYADCLNANFAYADCDKADFQGAECVDAHFQLATCNATNFFKADCSYAHFQYAQCAKANFQEANCTKTSFQEAKCPHVNYQKAKLKKANFQDAKFNNTNFQDANLLQTNFKNTKRSRANFEGARNLTLYTLSLFT